MRKETGMSGWDFHGVGEHMNPAVWGLSGKWGGGTVWLGQRDGHLKTEERGPTWWSAGRNGFECRRFDNGSTSLTGEGMCLLSLQALERGEGFLRTEFW